MWRETTECVAVDYTAIENTSEAQLCPLTFVRARPLFCSDNLSSSIEHKCLAHAPCCQRSACQTDGSGALRGWCQKRACRALPASAAVTCVLSWTAGSSAWPWIERTSASWQPGLPHCVTNKAQGSRWLQNGLGEGARREVARPDHGHAAMDSCVCLQTGEFQILVNMILYHCAWLGRWVEGQESSMALRWPVPGSCSYHQGAGWLAWES